MFRDPCGKCFIKVCCTEHCSSAIKYRKFREKIEFIFEIVTYLLYKNTVSFTLLYSIIVIYILIFILQYRP